MRSIYKVVAIVALLASMIPTEVSACQCHWPDMTGEWRANDGGVYFVRQMGNDIWWVGLSPDAGKQYTNVFKGVKRNDIVDGSWVDVRGAQGARGLGTLRLRLTGVALRKVSSGGGPFGAKEWSRHCGCE